MSKEIEYYIWTGPTINGDCYHTVELPNDIKVEKNVGPIPIKKGDILSLENGCAIEIKEIKEVEQKAFLAEYPFGKANLEGTPITLILNTDTRKYVQHTKSSEEVYKKQLKEQKKRTKLEVLTFAEAFIYEVVDNYKQQLRQKKQEALSQVKKMRNDNAVDNKTLQLTK